MRKLVLFLLVPGLALAIWGTDSLNVNHWHVLIHNDGVLGLDQTQMNFPGGYWPSPLRNFYIFGGGFWVGCVQGNETLVSSSYNPNSGSSEFGPTLCRYWRAGYNDSADRVYNSTTIWPPPLGRFPMAPQSARSNQDLWYCCGDSDPALHDTTSQSRPLGIDLALTTYAFNDSTASDFFFVKCELLNGNDYGISDAYLGFVMDFDIGTGDDDMVGFIRNRLFTLGSDTVRVRNTGFGYDRINYEPVDAKWQGGTPGMVAVSFLNPPGDTTDLSAFKRFTLDIDPVTDPTQYQTLRGYDYRTGEYQPFDSLDESPADKRFLEAVGPVELPAQSSRALWFAVIGAPFGDSGEHIPRHDTSGLAIAYRAAQDRFQQLLGIEEHEPARAGTFSVHPTVFGPSLPLSITLAGDREAKVTAYDMNGRIVRRFAGRGRIIWNGAGADGRMLPAGVYFLRASGSESATFKVVLSR